MKKKMKHPESDLQRACVTWFRLQYPFELLFAIPNGGTRVTRIDKNGNRYSPEAARMKAEGLVSGIPDLFLAKPSNSHSGLFIEMKSKTGKPSPEQLKICQKLIERDYKVIFVNSFEKFTEEITKYLQNNPKIRRKYQQLEILGPEI